MKLLTEIKVKPNYTETDIFNAIFKKYGVAKTDIENF